MLHQRGVLAVAAALPLIAVGVLLVLQSNTNDRLTASLHDQQVITYTNAVNNRDGCVRAVQAREKLINVFDGIRKSAAKANKERIAAWNFYQANVAVPGQAATGAPVEEFAQKQIAANAGERERLAGVEPALLAWVQNATQGISEFPASQNPHKVNLVNCQRHYPVPPKP